jgi:exonuclease III
MKKLIYISFISLYFYFDVFSQNTIKIDGFFDDWNSNLNTYIDDSTDAQGVELLDFSVCNDNEYLYIKIRCGSEIDLTEQFYNPAEIFINIDADNNSSTGYSTNNIGSEYGINFFDKFIFDDSDPNMIDTLSLYDLEVVPLPTYSSDEFEIAINRSLFSDTICISIREKVGNDFMPDNGSVFRYVFDNCSSPTTIVTDFVKNDPSNLRLMTYNVWSNGLVSNNRVDEHRRIFASANADIITFQECGSTTYNDVLSFLNTSPIYYPYIYPDLNSGNLTISKYPSLQSWQVADRIDAELIDLPDSLYATDILILNGHPPCCSNNQGRQENFDALIQFIHDAKTVGGIIDLPINTPISFSGDMNLVGYSEQYYTIVNGTISDTVTFGNGGLPDWDNTQLEDQICYFNEKDISYTWDKTNPSYGDYPPGRLDFVFFTNSVMSVDKSFIISTEHMSSSLLSQNNLFWNDTKDASDHFPIVVDFVLPMINQTGIIDKNLEKSIIRIIDLLGRDINENTCKPLFYIYDNGTIEKKIILE